MPSTTRADRFMPAGVPRYIKCWYSGPDGFIDRYIVIFTGRHGLNEYKPGGLHYPALAMSGAPFWPQGFCQHCSAIPGRHLGRRIKFQDLPQDCQTAVLQDCRAIWRVP